MIGKDSLLSQSWTQIRDCTILGVNELLKGSRTRPPVLNAHSDATLEIGMANTSRTISARIGNLGSFNFPPH